MSCPACQSSGLRPTTMLHASLGSLAAPGSCRCDQVPSGPAKWLPHQRQDAGSVHHQRRQVRGGCQQRVSCMQLLRFDRQPGCIAGRAAVQRSALGHGGKSLRPSQTNRHARCSTECHGLLMCLEFTVCVCGPWLQAPVIIWNIAVVLIYAISLVQVCNCGFRAFCAVPGRKLGVYRSTALTPHLPITLFFAAEQHAGPAGVAQHGQPHHLPLHARARHRLWVRVSGMWARFPSYTHRIPSQPGLSCLALHGLRRTIELPRQRPPNVVFHLNRTTLSRARSGAVCSNRRCHIF